MEKDLFVSYVTVSDTLQNIARMVHADLSRELRRKYGRWDPRNKEIKNQ